MILLYRAKGFWVFIFTDFLLTRELKAIPIQAGRAREHHVLQQSAWLSFYIRSKEDILQARAIMQLARDLIIAANN